MRQRTLAKLFRLIESRLKAEAAVEKVNQKFQPKLDKLITQREIKTSKNRVRALHLTTQIKMIALTLTGEERSAVRKRYPALKELP